jgi:hypothetical protein
MGFVRTADHLSWTGQWWDHAWQARMPLDMPGASRPACLEPPSSSSVWSCLVAGSHGRRSRPPDACARSSRSPGGSAPLRIPTTAGVATQSLDCVARLLSMTVLCPCQPPTCPDIANCCIPCRCSSTGVCRSFLSLKNPQRPWSGVPVTFSSIFTGFGSFWASKSFSLTESVCLGRRPVALTAEFPLSLLLSLLHRAGDVEKHALGALRAHWTEGTRKESTTSDFDARLGRNIREDDIAAMMSAWAVLQLQRAQPAKVARKVRPG